MESMLDYKTAFLLIVGDAYAFAKERNAKPLNHSQLFSAIAATIMGTGATCGHPNCIVAKMKKAEGELISDGLLAIEGDMLILTEKGRESHSTMNAIIEAKVSEPLLILVVTGPSDGEPPADPSTLN